jgi:hypothetical protein
MSNHRCPLCGANHKEEAEFCRLCGQSLAPGAVTTAAPAVARPVRAVRGTKGMVLIGLGLVVAVLLAAVVFGVVRENAQIRKARELVTGQADGWTPQPDDQGRFTIVLPGTRTREVLTHAATDDRRITAWHADLGDDTEVLAGWGKVSAPLANGVITPPAAYLYLREVVVPRWLAAGNLTANFVTIEETGAGGLPAVLVRTTQARIAHKGRDSYASLVLALNGGTLYVLQVLSIYKDMPQLSRMVDSFAVTGTVG